MDEPESTMDDDKQLRSADDLSEVDLCQVCEVIGQSAKAERYCADCNEKLCTVCTKRHAAAKATRDHKPISIEESKSKNPQYKCDLCFALEKTSPASVFCDECDEFLCKECANLHSGHKRTKQHKLITIETYMARDKTHCDLCLEMEAENWCKECTQTLCTACSTMHRKQRSTKLHILIPVSEMPAAETRDCSPCSLRQLKIAADKFCSECEEFLCTSCVTSHQTRKATLNHKLVDTSDYSKETKSTCDVCQLRGNVKEAPFACIECDEKLCIECKQMHNKQKATRDHDIVDVNSIQRTLVRCDICNDQNNVALSFCKECEEHMCEICTNAHKARKLTENHVLQTPEQSQAIEMCEPCFEDNDRVTAESFCITCDEKLCANCTKSHRNQKRTKDHDICGINDRMSLLNNIICDNCMPDGEQGKAVKFCNSCKENLCQTCVKQHTRGKATKDHKLDDNPKEHTSIQKDNVPTDGGCLGSDNLQEKGTSKDEKDPSVDDKRSILIKKMPGKPYASKVKADSLELSWMKPDTFTDSDSYQVRYKDLDHNSKWVFIQQECTLSTCVLTDLKANTKFIFQVRMVQDDEEGPYSEPSDEIVTLPSPGGRLLDFSQIVTQGNPSKYALPLTELRHARCNEAMSRKFELGPPPQTVPKEKTIMLVGATGTGKSTLVDGLVNYILGVNWNDPYRYTIIKLEEEEKERLGNQALSQTEWITCYIINPEKGSRLDYRLTIIDTPGFGDTRGLQRDNKIVDQIREMFSATSDQGVSVIDAVCFLIKAPDARLTATQKYIFHAIMSLFGQDIEENICSMITFADGQEPPVIASLEEAKLPFGAHFTFNNSGLFSNNTKKDSSTLSPMFWEMGVTSYRAFFDNLAKMKTKSLSLTKQVLDERQRLELTISSLQPQVDAGLSKIHDLKQEMKIIEQHEADIKDNKNFEYEVEETHQVQRELPKGQYVTNCLQCHMTCHDCCIYANDEDKKYCGAMDSVGGNCRICTDHCSWEQHRNTPYIFEFVKKKVKKTYQEKLKKYEDASGKLLKGEELLEKMCEEFEELEEGIATLMEEVNESNNRLKEIALRPNPLSMVDHIDLMVEAEKMEKKDGFQGRISALMECRKRADLTSDVARFNKEAAGTNIKRTNKDKKPKKSFSLTAFLKKWNPF